MKNKDNAKILVVDDQIHALKGVSRIMRGAGYETFEASNGTDCLKIALEHKPNLILLDVVLPDIDGREVCRRIKSDPQTANIHVVLLSSIHIESDSQAEGLEHGADGYIARPIPNRELLARVKAILRLKYAESQLRESEARYRIVADFTYDWEYWMDAEGKLLYCSPSCERITGYTAEELISDPDLMNRIIHPDDRNMMVEHYHNMGKVIPDAVDARDFRIIRRDGATRWIAHVCQPVYGQEGQPSGRRGSNRDITDRKRAENELRASESRFRSYFELPLIGIAITSLDKDWLEVNSTLCDMLGYSRQELNAMTWTQLTHPDDLEADLAQFNRMLAGQIDNYFLEKRFIRKDGDIIWTSLSVGCVRKPDGTVDYLVVLLQDITLRKKAEEDLKSSETRYRQLADVTFEGIIFHDEGLLLQANDQFFRMFGYEPDELVGNQIMEKTLTPDSREIVKAKIAERSTESYVAVGLRKDGAKFPIEIRARIREVEGKQIRATAIRDLSMLKNLEAQLLQAQKMEAIGTLAGGIAHDFNNLLQTVLGYSEFMLQRKKEGEPDYADLQKIYQAGKRGADLVKNLLTFSRRADTHYLPVDLNQEITAVRGLLSRTIPKTININLHLSGNVEYIKADPSQIGQVLMNLAVNARDAMPDGGTLTIETTEIQVDEKYCNTYPEAKPGSYVLLTISDTGQGMDNETLSHIFEPFFSTKEVGKGTGLGLATVYGIVKHHQGRITCFSELGHGTTFKIYLPAIQAKKELETTTLEKAIAGGAETVLLVDDDDDIRDLVAKFLIEFGYSVITAVNGKEAVEIYQREGASISVIILDLIMPVMDGRRCLAEILRINPNAKIIVASGYSEGGPVNGVMKVGAKRFVQKPYNMSQLLTTVSEILDKD